MTQRSRRDEEQPIRHFVVGSFALDNIVLPSGESRLDVSGGNAMYAAVGARLWLDRVGVATRISNHFPKQDIVILKDHGIDFSGLSYVADEDIRLWILYEGEKSRQIIYRLDSGSIEKLVPQIGELPESYHHAHFAHICGIPLRHQKEWIEYLSDLGIHICLDLLPIPQLLGEANIEELRDMTLLSKVNVFMPSREEVEAIWGSVPLLTLMEQIAGAGPEVVVIKMGKQGSLIFDSRVGKAFQIPKINVNTLDTTGAGDSYCGGFMAGYSDTENALEAGCRATVSSSFVVERIGALTALNIEQSLANERLAVLRNKVIDVGGEINLEANSITGL